MLRLSRTFPLRMCTTFLLLTALSSPSPLGRHAPADRDHHQQLVVGVSFGWVSVKGVIDSGQCTTPLTSAAVQNRFASRLVSIQIHL